MSARRRSSVSTACTEFFGDYYEYEYDEESVDDGAWDWHLQLSGIDWGNVALPDVVTVDDYDEVVESASDDEEVPPGNPPYLPTEEDSSDEESRKSI